MRPGPMDLTGIRACESATWRAGTTAAATQTLPQALPQATTGTTRPSQALTTGTVTTNSASHGALRAAPQAPTAGNPPVPPSIGPFPQYLLLVLKLPGPNSTLSKPASPHHLLDSYGGSLQSYYCNLYQRPSQAEPSQGKPGMASGTQPSADQRVQCARHRP